MGGSTLVLERACVSHPMERAWSSSTEHWAGGGGHVGVLLPFTSDSEKMVSQNYRLIPKSASAGLGLFCSGDFVTGLEGSSLTLG